MGRNAFIITIIRLVITTLMIKQQFTKFVLIKKSLLQNRKDKNNADVNL